jgi:hypothetical protein
VPRAATRRSCGGRRVILKAQLDDITNRVWTKRQEAFPVIYFVLHAHILFTKLHEFSRLNSAVLCALPETSELWRCTTVSSIFPSFNNFSCSFLLHFVSLSPPQSLLKYLQSFLNKSGRALCDGKIEIMYYLKHE